MHLAIITTIIQVNTFLRTIFIKSNVYPFRYFKGIEIIIGDQHFFPLRELGVALSNGNLAKIGMSKTHTVMMESPYSECHNTDKIDTLLSREMSKLGLDYNRANCLLLCEQKVIIERIHCYDSRLPPIFGATKPCETNDEIDALLNINYNIGKL